MASISRVSYGPAEEEEKSLQYRRSLYIVLDMMKGDVLTPNNMRTIRPGLGLPPKYYSTLLGKTVRQDVKRGTALEWDLL